MTLKKIVDSLNPHERKILPFIKEKKINDICKKSNLNKITVLRALEYLKNKKIVELSYSEKKIIDLGINGILYKKKELPERRFLKLLSEKKIISIDNAKKQISLNKDEFKIALGTLKKKAMIEIKNKNIVLNTNLEEIAKKTSEEKLIEKLPLQINQLTPEQNLAFQSLIKRRNIIFVKEKTIINIGITKLGKEILNYDISKEKLIEQLTPELLRKESNWKGKKFRRYDIESPVPKIYGGKRNFVNQSIDSGRKIWTEMGFKEMKGNLIQNSFWNFDALFTPQDHPAREMQDTFFLNKKIELPEEKLLNQVKLSHEKGIDNSSGWNYQWSKEEAKKLLLRTHTTCLSAQTLYNLGKSSKKEGKFFSLGKVFRNETVDWKHGFEFYQTEGIVIGKDVTLRNLLGYLQEFYKKMGFPKVKFRPGYFPYTEPSVEIDIWHPIKKEWLELGGAGIFRPEVTIPLIGNELKVLAWGLGFDRIITDYYKIKDLRELYKNDLNNLRKMKSWV